MHAKIPKRHQNWEFFATFAGEGCYGTARVQNA